MSAIEKFCHLQKQIKKILSLYLARQKKISKHIFSNIDLCFKIITILFLRFKPSNYHGKDIGNNFTNGGINLIKMEGDVPIGFFF